MKGTDEPLDGLNESGHQCPDCGSPCSCLPGQVLEQNCDHCIEEFEDDLDDEDGEDDTDDW